MIPNWISYGCKWKAVTQVFLCENWNVQARLEKRRHRRRRDLIIGRPPSLHPRRCTLPTYSDDRCINCKAKCVVERDRLREPRRSTGIFEKGHFWIQSNKRAVIVVAVVIRPNPSARYVYTHPENKDGCFYSAPVVFLEHYSCKQRSADPLKSLGLGNR